MAVPAAIALVARNDSHRLAGAVDALLAQSPRPAIVVLDDCSHDATEPVLAALAATHPEVSCARTKARVGPVDAFRRAAALARERHPGADLFAWACADDMPDPDWLAPLVRALRRRPQRVAALPRAARPLAMRDVRDPARRAAIALAHPWPVLPTGIVFRFDLVRAVGGLSPVRDPGALLGTELALAGEVVTIDGSRYERGAWMRGGLTEAYPGGIPLAAMLPTWTHGHLAIARERARRRLTRGERRRAVGPPPGTAPTPTPAPPPSPAR
jgi:glycosyltransferase involved in cell wall biosynthesis